jgi:hypothetical protein
MQNALIRSRHSSNVVLFASEDTYSASHSRFNTLSANDNGHGALDQVFG